MASTLAARGSAVPREGPPSLAADCPWRLPSVLDGSRGVASLAGDTAVATVGGRRRRRCRSAEASLTGITLGCRGRISMSALHLLAWSSGGQPWRRRECSKGGGVTHGCQWHTRLRKDSAPRRRAGTDRVVLGRSCTDAVSLVQVALRQCGPGVG